MFHRTKLLRFALPTIALTTAALATLGAAAPNPRDLETYHAFLTRPTLKFADKAGAFYHEEADLGAMLNELEKEGNFLYRIVHVPETDTEGKVYAHRLLVITRR